MLFRTRQLRVAGGEVAQPQAPEVLGHDPAAASRESGGSTRAGPQTGCCQQKSSRCKDRGESAIPDPGDTTTARSSRRPSPMPYSATVPKPARCHTLHNQSVRRPATTSGRFRSMLGHEDIRRMDHITHLHVLDREFGVAADKPPRKARTDVATECYHDAFQRGLSRRISSSEKPAIEPSRPCSREPRAMTQSPIETSGPEKPPIAVGEI